MFAIPIHRINDLELRAEALTNDFVSLHINRWTSATVCHSLLVLKGPTTVHYIIDRAFNPDVNPAELQSLLQIGFKFLADVPQHIPLLYHLQQLYPEYFI